jgi:hypothetical protein
MNYLNTLTLWTFTISLGIIYGISLYLFVYKLKEKTTFKIKEE